MTSWKTYKLGDILNFRRGHDLPKTEMVNGEIPVAGSNGVIGYHNVSTPIEPCITIGRSGNVGTPYIYDKCWAHNTVLYVDDFKGNDPLYLYYLLKTIPLASYGGGSAVPTLNRNHIHPIEIKHTPSLEKQRRIVGILGAIDDKIENNRRINTNLELQAQALYKQWFVDFEFPNEEGEPYKSSGGKMVDSELGPIPEGWRVIGYCDAVDIKGGGTPPTNNPEFWNGSIPFFTPKDVPSDCFAIHTEKSITEAGLSNCNSKLYAKDTVFITARGTVGKVVMAGCFMAMNQTNYALIGKNELSQYFVYLLTIALVDRLLKKANGAVFNAITTRDFEGEQIVHPTNFVLGKFIDIISPLYQQVLSIAKENETLAILRDTLLPKLMNGEIKM